MKKNKIEKPKSKRDEEREIAYAEAHSLSWAGPLPLPNVLREYDSIVPNAADRIIKMAEKQEDHRISI